MLKARSPQILCLLAVLACLAVPPALVKFHQAKGLAEKEYYKSIMWPWSNTAITVEVAHSGSLHDDNDLELVHPLDLMQRKVSLELKPLDADRREVVAQAPPANTNGHSTGNAAQLQALDAATIPGCRGDSVTWNAGWGLCSTYGGHNRAWCDHDKPPGGLTASQVCPQCAKCSASGTPPSGNTTGNYSAPAAPPVSSTTTSMTFPAPPTGNLTLVVEGGLIDLDDDEDVPKKTRRLRSVYS